MLRDVPVWTFHGARDLITPISETQSMVLALELCGGNVAFTIFPESDHDVWTATYNDPQFYSWLLDQNRSNFSEPTLDPVAEDLDYPGLWGHYKCWRPRWKATLPLIAHDYHNGKAL
ncbi:MAG: hypothetical protein AB9866_12835 [Syntrophobacteraceae bacterium]